MFRTRAIALVILALVGLVGWATFKPDAGGFKLGLDLAGGSHLVYTADTSAVALGDKEGALASLRQVVERRVNLFGVSEPLVQTEKGGLLGQEDRLIVELPGITDLSAAVAAIGKTPTLDFRLFDESRGTADNPAAYLETGLTGRYIDRAELSFGQPGTGLAGQPFVLIHFDEEGAKRFEELTGANVGRQLGIFLDGAVVSAPVIRSEISGGSATIEGNFTPQEAKELVENLNFGALPVPIELSSTAAVGPTLGASVLDAGVLAGLIGFLIVALFMILWYRIPGLVSVVALIAYSVLVLGAMKAIPVVVTASGIAGFILSLGMAVDANVIIFERIKEERARGRELREAITAGFARAWTAIRDSNVTTLFAAVILFWLGSPIVQGFALVFALGVLVSMFSALTVSRLILLSIAPEKPGKLVSFLFGAGIPSRQK